MLTVSIAPSLPLLKKAWQLLLAIVSAEGLVTKIPAAFLIPISVTSLICWSYEGDCQYNVVSPGKLPSHDSCYIIQLL